MEILLLLIPLSVVLVFLIGAGFWWSVRTGQFDDLEGPAHRILDDDDSGGPGFDLDQPRAPEPPVASRGACRGRADGNGLAWRR